MKKIVILFLILFLVLFIILVVLRILTSDDTSTPTAVAPTPTRYIPPPLPTIPPEDVLFINGVEVNNIYRDARERNLDGDVDFSSSPSYSIAYISEYKNFIISILALPFEENRALAESEFLQKLGVSQEEACKLSVSISVPYSVDPELSGIRYPLSFCQQ